MNKIIKNLVALTCLLILAGGAAFAQGFEGVIEFKKYSQSDTTRYRYYVKDVNVRIEELDNKGNVTGIMIVLPKINSVRALSPERKLYMEVPNNNPPAIKGKPEVQKTKNTKEIAGIKCTQWRIKSTDEKTEVSYWVANGGWDFFLPLIKTLNRKDKLSYYFLSIPDNAGFFPLEGDERTLTRDFRNMIKVDKITKQALDNKLFTIPADYKKYEK